MILAETFDQIDQNRGNELKVQIIKEPGIVARETCTKWVLWKTY